MKGDNRYLVRVHLKPGIQKVGYKNTLFTASQGEVPEISHLDMRVVSRHAVASKAWENDMVNAVFDNVHSIKWSSVTQIEY